MNANLTRSFDAATAWAAGPKDDTRGIVCAGEMMIMHTCANGSSRSVLFGSRAEAPAQDVEQSLYGQLDKQERLGNEIVAAAHR
jgi:hypothetical protein